MRKRLIASAFIALLFCAPVFAGHMILGGGRTEWCACGSLEECICEPGEEPMGMRVNQPDKSAQDTPIDFGSETLFVLAALVLWFRYKA